MAIKELSNYFSDDEARTATVYRLIESELPPFMTTVMNDSGTTFKAYFETLEDAENLAESWVLND